MSSVSSVMCALSCALLLQACNNDKAEAPISTTGAPMALEDALLYTGLPEGEDAHEALLLDLKGKGARLTHASLPEGEPHMFARTSHQGEVLVLTAGAPARLVDGEGRDAVASYLLLFDRDGEQKRFALSGSYAALSQSDDGRFMIAHQPGGPWSSADSIAVIDLESAASDQPIPATNVRALDGQGPSAVAFAPKGSRRRLAVLVMSDAINVLDLDHLDRKDKVLPLKLPNGSGSLRATKVLFAGDRCFVQADRGTDVFAVTFEDAGGVVRASLSTFATETALTDIELLEPEDGGAQRLLALGSNSLRLIDTKTGKGESSSTGTGFVMAEPFVGKSPFDDAERPRALLYAKDNPRIGFVDLQAELVGSERTVEVLSLSGAIMSLTMVESAGIAIVLQSDQRVSLIDLAERTVSSLSAGQPLKELVLDQRAGVSRAWVLTTAGTLGAIDLDRRSASEVLLSRRADWMLPLPGETPRVVIGHDSSSGALTLLEAANPTRSSAREVLGFLYSNYLD
jgi:hypothetical protein